MGKGKDWTLEEEQIIHKYYRSEGIKGVHKRIPYRTTRSIHAKAYSMGIRFYHKKYLHRQWSTQELNILEQFYPIEGANCYKRLSNRTRSAVEAYANRKGLKFNGWYPKEIDILKKNLEATMEELQKLLPNRTQRAIRWKIRGLKKTSSETISSSSYEKHRWSKQELDILKKNIGVTKEELQELLPHLSWGCITNRRGRLKRSGEIIPPETKKNLPWAPEEIAILQKYYATEGTECQKRLPNRTKWAISGRAKILGLKFLWPSWSSEENEIIRKNSHLTIKALQKLLPNRTFSAVVNQKSHLGLGEKTTWSSQEDAILRHYYPIEGTKCQKRLPNRNQLAIRIRAARLKIKYIQTDLWTTEELEILRQFYPIEGLKCKARLPNKSDSAIISSAKRNGLSRNK